MKKTFILLSFALLGLCTISCSSKKEKAVENYLMENDYPELVAGLGLINGKLIDYSIENFEKTPVDTFYEYQYFAPELDEAVDKMKFSGEMYCLNLEYWDVTSEYELEESRMKWEADSTAAKNAVDMYEKLKKEKSVFAFGYEFDICVKTKIAGKKHKSTRHMIAYITNNKNEDVINCEEFKK